MIYITTQIKNNLRNDKLKSYSKQEIAFFSNGNNLIDGISSDIMSFVSKFYDETTKRAKKKSYPTKEQKMFLGRIKDNLALQLNKILNACNTLYKVYDTTDTNVVISSNNIEHIYNKHGNEKRKG